MTDTLADLADVCGCDAQTSARNLIPVQTAIDHGLGLVTAVGADETVGLEAAIGRILAHDLNAPFPLPPFDNSAMDGYALRSRDFTGPGPWTFNVAGRVAAGDDTARAGIVGAGQAFRIFTGAGIPLGADAVIMQEHVRRNGDRIEIDKPVAFGNCIRLRGEDARQGALLLPAGTLIGPREIGAIASVGLAEVGVRRKVRIALFCTGSELRQPGESLAPGQIYNSNRFILLAALNAPWVELKDFGAIEDDPVRLRRSLTAAAKDADLIVTTGGVSVGEEDHMVDQLREAGGEIEVMKIAMKPGKPLSVGTLGNAVFVGLPGNPVAAFTTWKIIGSRIAAKLSGQCATDVRPPFVEAAIASDRRPGRQEYRPARIVGMSPDGRPRVEMLDHSYSAKISLICKCDGLAVIPAAKARIEAGERLEFVYL